MGGGMEGNDVDDTVHRTSMVEGKGWRSSMLESSKGISYRFQSKTNKGLWICV